MKPLSDVTGVGARLLLSKESGGAIGIFYPQGSRIPHSVSLKTSTDEEGNTSCTLMFGGEVYYVDAGVTPFWW